MGEATIEKLIDGYVDRLKETGCGLSNGLSPRVERALRRVPRHRLVETFFYLPWPPPQQGERPQRYEVDPTAPTPEVLELVYSDQALITRLDEQGRPTSSTSQPSLVAIMLEELELAPGMKVLEIGAGTGYNAALIAEMVGDPALVTTVDIQPDVVAQTTRLLRRSGYEAIRVLHGDGAAGNPEGAPYDRIVAAAGCPEVSWAWAQQLAPNGLMLVPLQHGGPFSDPLVKLGKADGHLSGRMSAYSGFMQLQGELSGPNPWPDELPDPGERPPDEEHPLPPALTDSGMDERSFRACRRAWWDFHFFLAMCDLRAHRGPEGLGMAGGGGSMLRVTEDGVRVWGDSGIYRDLMAIYDQWESLGRPQLTDWETELHPLPCLALPRRPSSEQAPWMVERGTSRQLFRLAPSVGREGE
ncbi:MAG: methyltransferase domain-containing protein [Actinomycetota bacterium]|nr:methyltransferase domain-containing protein [Actinomycetota bacterium]